MIKRIRAAIAAKSQAKAEARADRELHKMLQDGDSTRREFMPGPVERYRNLREYMERLEDGRVVELDTPNPLTREWATTQSVIAWEAMSIAEQTTESQIEAEMRKAAEAAVELEQGESAATRGQENNAALEAAAPAERYGLLTGHLEQLRAGKPVDIGEAGPITDSWILAQRKEAWVQMSSEERTAECEREQAELKARAEGAA